MDNTNVQLMHSGHILIDMGGVNHILTRFQADKLVAAITEINDKHPLGSGVRVDQSPTMSEILEKMAEVCQGPSPTLAVRPASLDDAKKLREFFGVAEDADPVELANLATRYYLLQRA